MAVLLVTQHGVACTPLQTVFSYKYELLSSVLGPSSLTTKAYYLW
eukprot:COSAG01_NODE_2776_length_7094_cov_14.701930_3_plen_45_part_00